MDFELDFIKMKWVLLFLQCIFLFLLWSWEVKGVEIELCPVQVV